MLYHLIRKKMNILIHWKEDFSVKIKELDQQHKKLFDLINLLYDSYMRKENDEMLAQILADLKEYAFVHFKEEEKYFSHAELIGYKEVPNHILEHQLFIKSVEKFQAKYQSYGSA